MSLDTSTRPITSTPPPVRHSSEVAAIRALLEEHRQARVDQVNALDTSDPSLSDLDPGVRLRALAAAKATLADIDQALAALDDGSYGFCARCTASIPAERLLAVPYARYCVPCA